MNMVDNEQDLLDINKLPGCQEITYNLGKDFNLIVMTADEGLVNLEINFPNTQYWYSFQKHVDTLLSEGCTIVDTDKSFCYTIFIVSEDEMSKAVSLIVTLLETL